MAQPVHVNDNRLQPTNRDPVVVQTKDVGVLHPVDLTQDGIHLPRDDDREVLFVGVRARALLHATIEGIVEAQYQVVRTLPLKGGDHLHQIVDVDTVIQHLTRIKSICFKGLLFLLEFNRQRQIWFQDTEINTWYSPNILMGMAFESLVLELFIRT